MNMKQQNAVTAPNRVKRIILSEQLNVDGSICNPTVCFRQDKQVVAGILAEQLNAVLTQFPEFNLGFQTLENGEYQVQLGVNFEHHMEICHLSTQEEADELPNMISQQQHLKFDVTTGRLIRSYLYTIEDGGCYLQLVAHRSVANEAKLYDIVTLLNQGQISLAESRATQSEIPDCLAQKQELADTDLTFWQSYLSNSEYQHDIQMSHKRNRFQSFYCHKQVFELPAESYAKLKSVSEARNLSLNHSIFCVYQCLLQQYSQSANYFIGFDFASSSPTARTVSNHYPVKNAVSEHHTFEGLMDDISAELKQLESHSQLDFDELLFSLQMPFSAAYQPVFQLAYSHINLQSVNNNCQQNQFTPAHPQDNATKLYEINLTCMEYAEKVEIELDINATLFSEDFARRFALDFLQVASSLAQQPNRAINSLCLIAPENHSQLLKVSDGVIVEREPSCLHTHFERTVEQRGEATALVFEDQSLTYLELNAKANQLAALLKARGMARDTLIGLYVHRSLEMVIAILGILKAGGAYVPLDPTYPEERVAFMAEDSQVSAILTTTALLENISSLPVAVVCLDNPDLFNEFSDVNPVRTEAELVPEHLAYVIYTSGSTGKPKGVMVEHHSIMNRILWMIEHFQLNPKDCYIQKTPYTFDVSLWEFFCPLLSGGKLVMAKPEGHKDPAYLNQLINQWHVTRVHFVPSMLSQMLLLGDLFSCISLTHIFCSGEALPEHQVQEIMAKLPSVGIYNLYGPTEAAVEVSYWDCKQNALCVSVPIGLPISNTQLFVLDDNQKMVPYGAVGELHIGGQGVARGYLGRDDLTRERFVPNPFYNQGQSAIFTRLYRSGDLVRWLEGGSLEYLGRADHQVKLRGYRIELGEIERTLEECSQVNSAITQVVRTHQDDERLVAWVVLSPPFGEQREALDQIKRHLRAKLPEFMIPAHFVVLEQMPLTASGKVDRKALPEFKMESATETLVPPTSDTEKVICRLAQEALGVKNIGTNSSFFGLGGHSLLLTRFLARIEKELLIKLSIHHVFEMEDFFALSKHIDALKNTHAIETSYEDLEEFEI